MKVYVRQAALNQYQPPLQGENLRLPIRPGDVGHDICSSEDRWCEAGTLTYVRTGVHVEAARGLWYTISARSSLVRRGGLVPFNVIDAEYQGELLVGVFNTTRKNIHVQQGERIAQLVFFRQEPVILTEVQEFFVTERGEAGFGSTGKM